MGTVFLIGSALQRIGAGSPDGTQLAERFTKTLMDKVGQWAKTEMVEPADLPMVREVVKTVFDEHGPVACRDQTGPVPDSEPQAMTCALALIADSWIRSTDQERCEHGLLTTLGGAVD
ncbi:hypothetical protein [Streptomyces sp. RPT161]|uniref:hypothetical protein n=1 Tax=Streptomyces sp. RPT161 TaxID=3015993 RepID=UPI0022B93013|nr:hypothetical protein [Streptomyces sp. RPT161]